jgi:gluconolactonase
MRFTVHGDNSLGDGVVFAEVEGGTPDGVRVDEYGNVWTSAGKGIQCYAPDGTLLGRINVPEIVSNLEFGGPRFNRIFITATTSLYSIHVKLAGIRRG